MKPEDQRLAIGEVLGWKRHTDKEHQYSGSHLVVEGWIRQKPGTTGLTIFDFEWRDSWNLPDYLNDLNAMHAAEQTLRDQCLYWPDYIDELVTLCTNAYPHLPNEKLEPNWSATVGATAEQRAEAFLRCLGLWKD